VAKLGGAFASAGLLAAALALTGCSSAKQDPFAGKASPMYKGLGPIPKGGGRYHVGNPYQVAGRTYYPREDRNYDKVGIASWYGPSFHKRMTSNGEWFDQEYLSAAHPTLPLPSYVRVTNLENRRSIVVRVNDRGPFVDDRIIDLSKKSADALGFRQKGMAKVRVTYLGTAPLNDKGSHLAAMNRGTAEPVQVARAETPAKKVNYVSRNKPAAPAPAPAPAPENRDGYFVQVASYSDPENAGRAKSRLAGLGPVSITPVEAGMGTFYRVRVGPLESVEEASSALEQIRAAGHFDARVVNAQN
jgi:rare lipoprotein A